MTDRIAEIRIHTIRAPISERFGWSLNWTSSRETTIVEVVSSGGLTGWGEGSCPPALLDARRDLAIGRSPLEVEGIYECLRAPAARPQGRPGAPACPGLDIALWDLAGKLTGLPAGALLGHPCRDRVGAYCTALYRKDWPDLAEGLAEEALGWKERGFRMMKMKIGFAPDLDVRIVRRVREAIGPETGLGVDSNCAYDAGTAVRLGRRLEDFDLMWWEEPVLADNYEGYRRLRDALRIPLAGGETGDLDNLVEHYVLPGLVDILQPDLEHIGLTGARMLSRLCWSRHQRIVPHNWGSAIRTAATLQWMSIAPPLTPALNPPEVMLEFDQTECPFRDPIVKQRIALDPADGCIPVPKGPGLGIDVDTEALASFRVGLTCVR